MLPARQHRFPAISIGVVDVTERVRAKVRIPVAEKEAWEAYIREEFGTLRPYTGTESERAVREFLDMDRLADLEGEVDNAIQAAGRRPMDLHEKDEPCSRPVPTGDTEPVFYRWHPDVRAAFIAEADRDWDSSAGRLLANILADYRDGGKARRITEKYRRVSDDVEALLAEVNTDEGGRKNSRQRKRAIICRRLQDKIDSRHADWFTTDELEAVIADVAGETVVSDYTDKVLKELSYAEDPDEDDLIIPESEARKKRADSGSPSPDAPAIDRKDYDNLSRDEKVRGIQIELVREANNRRVGKAAFDVAAVKDDVFDGDASDGSPYSLMEKAGNADGFNYQTRNGNKRVTVDLPDVTDADLLSVVDDQSIDRTDVETEDVDDELDMLESGHPAATDSGES